MAYEKYFENDADVFAPKSGRDEYQYHPYINRDCRMREATDF